jgi:DnaJ-domain-containing protein 1
MPQPVSSSEDYFSVFGVRRKFQQDIQELEKRFYSLSRVLHPDRFSTSGSQAQVLSLTRMSFINQAYSTLKTPSRLRDYLLKLEGIQAPKASMPAELAEDWFEIQDLIMDNPQEAKARVSDFKGELSRVRQEIDKKLLGWENEYDVHPSREILDKISHQIQVQSYLNSMQKDVERIEKNAYSN